MICIFFPFKSSIAADFQTVFFPYFVSSCLSGNRNLQIKKSNGNKPFDPVMISCVSVFMESGFQFHFIFALEILDEPFLGFGNVAAETAYDFIG